MSAFAVSRSWSAPAAGAAAAWRFARVLDNGSAGLQWVLRRNFSLTPAQLFAAYLVQCAISLAIALGFIQRGAAPLPAFVAIELLLVATALLLYARHAGDQEHITLAEGRLRVEHRRGSHTECAQFRAAWVRVEPRHGEGSLVELSGDGQQTCVGRYLHAELRTPLARELRAALRQGCAPPPTCLSNPPLLNQDLK